MAVTKDMREFLNKKKYEELLVKISMTSSSKKINSYLEEAGIFIGEVED